MGGGIFAESEIGHGARFTIRVPATLDLGAERESSPSHFPAPTHVAA
jgi:hypothetical protein